MLESQKRLIETCGKLTETSEKFGLPQTYSDEVKKLAAEIETRQLVVPVVGAFSAGKSTLINNCIGRKVLPVDITPETSLATELHYSETEYAEAVSKDGAAARYEIGDMPKLRDDAAKYAYAKVYLNSPLLKKIEPLVLVDMPGFDSPLDDHNKAILQYLDKGCYYIVLSSGVEEKTPSASLIRRLREITAMDRDFSFYISKSNMISTQDELDAILQHYKQTLSDNLDRDVEPRTVGKTETDAELLSLFENVDPDKLMQKLYRDSVK
jgi:ribosome biogenesis GTPase A